MKNLINSVNKEAKTELKNFKNDVSELTINDILKGWYYTDLLTPTKIKAIKAGAISLKDAKKMLIDAKTKKVEKRKNAQLQKIENVKNAPELLSASVQLTWVKSRMWGANPRPELTVITETQHFYHDSASVTGCGYCKSSTAVANVLNENVSILKLLYEAVNKKHAFPYGISNYTLPSFSGGVGVECFVRAFNSIGYDMKKTADGKMFDAWTIEKMSKKRKLEYKKRNY